MRLHLRYSLLMLPLLFMVFFAKADIPQLMPSSSPTSIHTPVTTGYILPAALYTAMLLQAHAHNDYENENPLLDALNHGFTSVEADVHLIGKKLYISHKRPKKLNPKRTLTVLYLDQLYERYQSNNGKIFDNSDQPLVLMIDIKTGSHSTYRRLKKILTPYLDMLTYWENDVKHPGAVTIILSGNRPLKKVAAEKKRYVAIDGRISDLGKGYSSELMPMVSSSYSRGFARKWLIAPRSKKRIARKIKRVSKKIHREGKKFRLWNTPENEQTWETLLHSGIDYLNSDRLGKLARFLRQKAALEKKLEES